MFRKSRRRLKKDTAMQGNEPIDLHDGTIRNVSIDYVNKTVSIVVIFKGETEIPSRKVSINIKDVKKLAIISNLDRLANLAKHFSNINDWDCDDDGSIEIDLCGGNLSFSAGVFEVSQEA